MDSLLEKLFDPFVWVALVAIAFNILLYRLNDRTFKLLYEKPRFEINVISVKPYTRDGMGGIETESCLNITFLNPSSFDNLIIYSTFKRYPFGPIIQQTEAGFNLPKYQRITHKHELDYEFVKNYKNKWVKLTLTDIKGSKISWNMD